MFVTHLYINLQVLQFIDLGNGIWWITTMLVNSSWTAIPVIAIIANGPCWISANCIFYWSDSFLGYSLKGSKPRSLEQSVVWFFLWTLDANVSMIPAIATIEIQKSGEIVSSPSLRREGTLSPWPSSIGRWSMCASGLSYRLESGQPLTVNMASLGILNLCLAYCVKGLFGVTTKSKWIKGSLSGYGFIQ